MPTADDILRIISIVKDNPNEEIIIGNFGIDEPGNYCYVSFVIDIKRLNEGLLKEGYSKWAILNNDKDRVIVIDLANDFFKKYPTEELLADLFAHEYIHLITGVDNDAMHDYPNPFPNVYQYNLPERIKG